MKRAVLMAVTGAWLLLWLQSPTPMNAQTADGLQFFKNYFLTGDYALGGVGLRGTGVNGIATGSIPISGVPANADVVAAYLYWQVVSKDTLGPDSGNTGVTFRDIPLQTSAGPVGKVLGQAGTAPCWSSGGGTGSSSGQSRTYYYRAEVLRYFDLDPVTGKPMVNGTHKVQIPDAGPNGNSVPLALGASLVLLYRDGTQTTLNAISIYDGGFTIDNSNRSMSQVIKGFYQPSSSPNAKISYIVGSGQSNKNENVFVNGSLFLTNPFGGFNGSAWDATQPATVDLGNNPESVSSVSTTIDTQNVQGSDCLTVGTIIFKTAVKDSDSDGLLDVWETATTPVVDPNNQPLPLLGSNPLHKDVFVELGYMKTDSATSYGATSKPAHSHLPGHEALKLVGDAYKNSPVPNPDGTTGINVHFDVGANYPAATDPLKDASDYIVPAGSARGGEAIDEMQTVCTRAAGAPPWECQFGRSSDYLTNPASLGYPGTVGWKTGFRYLRDQIISSQPPALLADGTDPCDAPGNDGPGEPCERRFDRNRRDFYHYALFAHAVGIPKSELPCLDSNDVPVDDVNGACAVKENPDFRVPSTITGVGDFPGGDVLITLGAFLDVSALPQGTPFMQGSTLAHEVGHNSERRHGGEAFEPNCKPTYLSTMNYLYQLRGLLDDAGRAHLDFSRGIINPAGEPLNETLLYDGSLSNLPYRIGWYVPIAGSYLEQSYINGTTAAAKKHCDGTTIDPLTEPPTVRIDARTAAGAIDWNANGVGPDGPLELDINFNGRTRRLDTSAERLAGSNDWANMRLNQVGGRRNVGGLYVDKLGRLGIGPLSLDAGRGDFGRGDFGRGDFGRGDFGRGDFGRGDLGRGDFGRGDFGRGDFGRGDFGRGDFGGGDLFVGNPDLPGGELDFETAADLSKTPPLEFTACVIGTGTCTGTQTHSVKTTWKSPNVGGVTRYIVYRVIGATLTPAQAWTQVGSPVPAVLGQEAYSLIDQTQLQNGQSYTYFAIAVYGDGVKSDASNLVTIVAINDAPTLTGIADQTIYANSSTGALAFTVGDEAPASVVLTGTSSNQTLVPNANIVFGGSGASRTVTVTPALNQTGTTTITITGTDGAGNAVITPITFLLTVKPLLYDFTGFLSPLTVAGTDASPTNSGTFNIGKAIPIKWQLMLGGVRVTDTASLKALVAVPGNTLNNPSCLANGTPTLFLLDPATGRPTGNSTYRYDTTNQQFIFNWDTSAASKTNCYRLTLTLKDNTPARVTIIRFK